MTAQIELSAVNKHFGGYHALRDVNLTIHKGDFIALVGPSGCGKSTLLRTIAGLEKISSGTIQIAGADVTTTPPRLRDIAMVFQSYALYPHMTVADNLTYALRLKGTKRAEARRRAEAVAEITGLSQLLDRYPRELSGGQRQRVAMGRAIVREPKAFLFDEPLSNLDAALRVHMRAEIRKLHNRLGATSVYVTHDQIEAMTMADHVVVMRAGIIEQQGAPLDLYDHPVNRFVAGFIGSPAMNFVEATVMEDGLSLRLSLPGAPVLQSAIRRPAGEAVVAGLRPEYLIPCAPGTPNAITLPLALVEQTGGMAFAVTDTDPALTITTTLRRDIIAGAPLTVAIEPARVHLFHPKDGTALRG
jgi:multiple sugar transport system ATP-binding protein